jgi:hypothetical protein
MQVLMSMKNWTKESKTELFSWFTEPKNLFTYKWLDQYWEVYEA